MINFVKAREKPQPQKHVILLSAADWQVRVDLGHQLKFSEQIIQLCAQTLSYSHTLQSK